MLMHVIYVVFITIFFAVSTIANPFAIFQSDGPSLLVSGVVVAVGDSLTLGVGSTNSATDNYPTLMKTEYGRVSSIAAPIAAIVGIGIDRSPSATSTPGSTPNLTSNAASTVDVHVSDNPQPYLLFWGGGNDMCISYGATSDTTIAMFQNYISARLVAGWNPSKIVVLTLASRVDLPEAKRTAFNAAVVSGAATYGYRLVRLDLNPNIGCDGCYMNSTYFNTQLHLTTAGYQIVADMVSALRVP